MSRPKEYDFSGWATKFNIKCADGRTIRNGAFDENDGATVPLVYNHDHSNIESVVGHMYLEHRDKGMYGYGTFNDNHAGQVAKELVRNGDIRSLSIYANKLSQDAGKNVTHGLIREVSLVLAGANPGAFIDNVIAHGDDGVYEDEESAYITCGEEDGLDLFHADQEEETSTEEDNKQNDEQDDLNHSEENREEKPMENKEEKGFSDAFIEKVKDKTLKEVIEDMKITDDEKNFIFNGLGAAYEDGYKDGANEKVQKEEDTPEMKHNVFDMDEKKENDFIIHSEDEKDIIKLAKNPAIGTLKNALDIFQENHADELAHAASNPFTTPSELFPEYKDVSNGNPEVLRNRIGWVDVVLKGVHSSPASFIKTKQIDERLAELRANGYVKGDQKAMQAARKVLSRKTSPQTIYVNNELDRDEYADIEDFDAIAYLKAEDTLHLKEELAKAILIGDGREEGNAHKINQENIRSIWNDDELYAIHALIDAEATKAKLQGSDASKYFGTDFVNAHAVVNAVYNARVNYRGSGKPVMFCSEEAYSWFALATDRTGHDAYDTEEKIKTKLQVSDIVTVDKFTNLTRTGGENKKFKLIAILVNLDDYIVGANKKGQLTSFDDFDIDFNKMKTMTETRVCGALRSPLTAMVIEQDVTVVA